MKPYNIYILDDYGYVWECEVPNVKEWPFCKDNYTFSLVVTERRESVDLRGVDRKLFAKTNVEDSIYDLVELTENERKNRLQKKFSISQSLITGFPYNGFIVTIDNEKPFESDAIKIGSSFVVFYECNYLGQVNYRKVNFPDFNKINIKLNFNTKQLPFAWIAVGPFHFSEKNIGAFACILTEMHWTSFGWKRKTWELGGNVNYDSALSDLEISYDFNYKILTIQGGETLKMTTEGTIRSNSSMDPGDDEWGYVTTRSLGCALRCTNADYSKFQNLLSIHGHIKETKFIWKNTITQLWHLEGITKFDLKDKLNFVVLESVGTYKWRE